jgi:2-oxoglutarate dehydrogenase E1 component
MKNLRFASRWNADTLDEYYARWLEDPDAVDAQWQLFFEGFELGHARDDEEAATLPNANGVSGNGSAATPPSPTPPPPPASTPPAPDQPLTGIDPKKQARVIGAIYAYRSIGHTQAHINPLFGPEPNPRLSVDRLGCTEAGLEG